MSPQQRRVAELLAVGMSNKDIARMMGIAEGTVRIHVSHVLRKLGAKNRTQAAIRWIGERQG